MGKPVDRSDDVAARVRNEAVLVLGQRKLLQRLVPGLMHAFIFWGFIVLFPTIVIAMIGAVDRHQTIPWLGAQGWFAALADLFVVLVLLGVVTAVVIRKVVRPARFEGSHRGEADLILGADRAASSSRCSCWHACADRGRAERVAGAAGRSLSNCALAPLRHGTTARVFERVFVWAHLRVRPRLPRLPAVLEAPAHRDGRRSTSSSRGRGGAGGSSRCASTCPTTRCASASGTVADLTWKEIVDGVLVHRVRALPGRVPGARDREAAVAEAADHGRARPGVRRRAARARGRRGLTPIAGNGVPEEMIWDCVTCGACVEACPVSIEHVDHIVDLRRQLVMVDSSFPAEAEPMLRDVEQASNPWGKPQVERASWAEELGVRVLEPGDPAPDVLYWVGCAASFDERARESAESTAKLLQAAGVDFAILGPRESCTGDPARRMGNEYVFQEFAEQNVATLDDAGVKKIVASCPHCFNTLGERVPRLRRQLRGRAPQRAARRARARRPARAGGLRHSRSRTTTRATWRATTTSSKARASSSPRSGKPIEMKRSGKKTFCCGAGGAHMWMEERGTPINEERVREAAETGAETLAVACPFCTVMLDDGVRAAGKQLRVVDVSTLLVEALDAAAETPSAGAPAPERRQRLTHITEPCSNLPRPNAG